MKGTGFHQISAGVAAVNSTNGSKMWRAFTLLVFLATASSSPVASDSIEENLVGAIYECVEKETSLCLKEKALKFTEKLAIVKNIDLFEGMSVINTGSARSSRSYEPLAEDPKAREQQLEERIANNVGDFLENHVIQLRLSDNSEDESRDLDEEGRGKKKKKIKQLLPLLILLKLKLAALVPLFLGIIAFAAVKALFLGKIAFAMSAISLIRKLLAKNQSSGWSSSPHEHHDSHPGYSYEPAQGWSRKASDAQSLAYSGQLRK